jgi:hypothetical protein
MHGMEDRQGTKGIESHVQAVGRESVGRKKEERLSMEYIVYVAIVIGLLLLCGCGVYCAREEQPARKKPPEVDDRENKKMENELRLRALSNVPTPWGWPGGLQHGSGATANGLAVNGGQAIHRWVDGLVSEKQTTENIEYQRRREASLRALLEDRFHSSGRASHAVQHGTNAPHQNVPAADKDRAEQASAAGLNGAKNHAPGMNGQKVASPPSRQRSHHHEPLSGVRTPWGW